RVEVVQDGDVGYVRFPAIDDQLPDGKTWVRAAKGEATADGFQFHEVEQFSNSDPRELLRSLRAVSGVVETMGTEELRGVETTHVRVHLDLSALAATVARSTGATTPPQSLLDRLTEQSGVHDVPLDLWVDSEGLVRKLSLDLAADETGTTSPGSAHVSF